MKKQLLTLGALIVATSAAFAQSASDRLDIYGKDGKFVSVMTSDVQEITVGKADSGEGYSSVSVTTPYGVKSRDIDNITEVKYSPIIPNLAHQIDTINTENAKIRLLDWRNNTDYYGEAQIDPTKPADWRGCWANGMPHFLVDTDKGFASEFTISGVYSGKVYTDNPNFVFWSSKENNLLGMDSYSFEMPFEPVVIEAVSWELDTYKDAPFLGTYAAYSTIPAEKNITANVTSVGVITFDANTTYTLTSTDSHEFDIFDLYSWDEEKNIAAYVPYEGELRNEMTIDVKHGVVGKFDGDFFFATVHNILDDKIENNVRYFASREDVTVTVASSDEYNTYTIIEAKPADGDATYYYYENISLYPIKLTADFSYGTTIGQAGCMGFLLEDGEKLFKYFYQGPGSKPEIDLRGLEYGVYTGAGDDLKLDGFGGCTLGEATGTYTLAGGIATVKINGVESIYITDRAAKTYQLVEADEWDGAESYTLETARVSLRGGELADNGFMSVTFNKDLRGNDAPGKAAVNFSIPLGGGSSRTDGISDLGAFIYNAASRTIYITNVYIGTSANSSGRSNIKLTVAEDKRSLWLDDTDSDRLYAVGNVGSYFLTGTTNTLAAPKLIAQGTGTEEDPYQLTTAEEIEAMKEVVSAATPTYFKLMNDIDMTGVNHVPTVGSANADFGKTIHFDGNNHVISNLRSVAENEEFYYASLFGVFTGSVKNLGLVDVELKSQLGVAGIGGYVGYGTASTVDNCYVTGKVESLTAYAAGLMGTNSADVTISNSYAQVDVKGAGFAGGLVGRGRNTITLSNCYVSGTVGAVAEKTPVMALVGATDKTDGSATLVCNNVVAVNTGATDNFGNYGTAASGEVGTDIKVVKTWDAFNQNLVFNELPALNWQENAEPAKLIAAGSGTQEDPYQLTTAEEIEAMKEVVSAATPTYFKLMNDIDMTGINHVPTVGSANADFGKTIHFDGNNHVISNLRSVAENEEFYYASLFGVFTGSVKNLGLVDVELKSQLGVAGIGGYVGYGTASTVDNCYVTGKVESLTAYAAGLMGTNSADVTISNSYAQVDVKGAGFAGGLVGRGRNTITLNNCYVSGTVGAVAEKTPVMALVGATDKTDGSATLVCNNVVAVNTGATDNFGNYGTAASGEVGTDIKVVKTWDAFNENLVFNELPALNWQENAVEGPDDPGTCTVVFAKLFDTAENITDLEALSPIHLNDDLDIVFAKNTGLRAPQYVASNGQVKLVNNNSVSIVGRSEDIAIKEVIYYSPDKSNTMIRETYGSCTPAGTFTVERNETFTQSWVDSDNENPNEMKLAVVNFGSGVFVKVRVRYEVVEPAPAELASKYTGSYEHTLYGTTTTTVNISLDIDKENSTASFVVNGMNSDLIKSDVDYTLEGNTITLKDVTVYEISKTTFMPAATTADIVYTVNEDGTLTTTQKVDANGGGSLITIDLTQAPLTPEVTEEPEPEPSAEQTVTKVVTELFSEAVADLTAISPIHLNDDIDLVFEQGTGSKVPAYTSSVYTGSNLEFQVGNNVKVVGRSKNITITKVVIACKNTTWFFKASSDPAETLVNAKPNITWTNAEGANAVTFTNVDTYYGYIASFEVTYTVGEGGDEPAPAAELAAKYTGAPEMDSNGMKKETETVLTFDKEAAKATLTVAAFNQTLLNVTADYEVAGNVVTLKAVKAYDPAQTLSPVEKVVDITFTIGEDGNLTSTDKIGVSAMGSVFTLDFATDPLVPEVIEEPEPEPVPVEEKSESKVIKDLFTESVTDLVAASPIHFNDDIDLVFEKGNSAPSATSTYSTAYINMYAGSKIKIVGRNENVNITKVDITCTTNSYTFNASSDPAETLTINKPNIVWENSNGANIVTFTNTDTFGGGRIAGIEITYTVPAEGGDEPEPAPAVELAEKYTGAPEMDSNGMKKETETVLTFDKEAAKATLTVAAFNQTLLNVTADYEVAGNVVTLKAVKAYDPAQTLSPVEKVVDITFTIGEDGNLTSTDKIGVSAMGSVFSLDFSTDALAPEATEEPAPAVELAAKYTGAPMMEAFGNKQATETTLTFDKEAGKATLNIKGMGAALINSTVDYTVEGTTVTLKQVAAYDPENTVSPVAKNVDVVFIVGDDGNLTGTQTIAGSAMGMVLNIDLSSAPLAPAE